MARSKKTENLVQSCKYLVPNTYLKYFEQKWIFSVYTSRTGEYGEDGSINFCAVWGAMLELGLGYCGGPASIWPVLEHEDRQQSGSGLVVVVGGWVGGVGRTHAEDLISMHHRLALWKTDGSNLRLQKGNCWSDLFWPPCLLVDKLGLVEWRWEDLARVYYWES